MGDTATNRSHSRRCIHYLPSFRSYLSQFLRKSFIFHEILISSNHIFSAYSLSLSLILLLSLLLWDLSWQFCLVFSMRCNNLNQLMYFLFTADLLTGWELTTPFYVSLEYSLHHLIESVFFSYLEGLVKVEFSCLWLDKKETG